MTVLVERFIRNNIDLIDSENWYELFSKAYDAEFYLKDYEELLNILLQIDIYHGTTSPIRTRLFIEKFTEVLKKVSYFPATINEVFTADPYMSFGYNFTDIKRILKKVFADHDLPGYHMTDYFIYKD